MNPYREPIPVPENSDLCVLCNEPHKDDYISLKHPSGIGSHNVCWWCVIDFEHEYPLPFSECEWALCYEGHNGLRLIWKRTKPSLFRKLINLFKRQK